MNLEIIDSSSFCGELIQQKVENLDIVIVKNLINPKVFHFLRKELSSWRENVQSADPLDHYPVGKQNLHINVCHKRDTSVLDVDKKIDYYEEYTNIDVYNYRIGNMYAEEVSIHIPSFKPIGESLLAKYFQIVNNTEIRHGSKEGKNLYFEIAHYHTHGGYIDKHTHLRNMNVGQRINMVTMMSQKSRDFENSGLFFEYENCRIDTTEYLNEGDAVFFRMDIPHWVTPTHPPKHQETSSGRWTITTFFY